MTAETIAPDSFAPIFEYFTAPARTAFSSFLDRLSLDLRADEAALIRTTGEEALKESARLKLSRLLLLELHAAKHAGELTANSDRERLLQFIEHARIGIVLRYFDAMRSGRLQFDGHLRVIDHHAVREGFDVFVLGVLLRKLRGIDLRRRRH